ncbi:YetF domain-containing protein [Pseudalkalibacillus sp. R45]|uniref:YetF domain-containing protein n=1 Tax=Pseudalkalibacillus sp. R45 TaxID=3457433 RepID=UPI003FCE6644
MELLHMSSKLVLGFFLLFLLIRIIGKKLIDQFTPFHFISAIVLSELLGNAVYEKTVPISYILFSILLWGSLLFSVEYLLQKFQHLRSSFEGKPSMVIRNGQIDFEQLKKSRMNINQLQSQLRQSEIFSVREVAFALIESNGSISILKKSPYQKTTLQDFNMPPHPVYLPITLIRDGELIKANLKEINKDDEWLRNQLLANGVSKIEDVLFAEWLENDGLFVVPHKTPQHQKI